MSELELPQVMTSREYGYETVRALRRTGAVRRVRRDAYVRPIRDARPWERDAHEHLARCVAASQRLTGLYAFTLGTAARLFGWKAPIDPQMVDIVQRGRPSTTRQSDIRRHVRPWLTAADIVDVLGLPVLRERLTIIECARVMPPVDALITIDSALQHLADVDKFDREDSLVRQCALLEELGAMLRAVGPGRHVVRAREVLRYANGLAGSPRESRLRWLALAVGLPEPILEWEQVIDGARYFSDIAFLKTAADWPRRAITFEYDGTEKYGTDPLTIVQSFAQEKERHDAIEGTDVAVYRLMKGRMSNDSATARWMLSKFPPSTIASLTPRPLLEGPPVILPRRRGSTPRPR